MRTGKCTVSSRCVVLRMRRMFGSRWSLSAAMLNCSSSTSHGSRWVWSMTAALVFTCTSDASWSRCLQLFDHEPIIGRLARRVRAVPILQHDAAETLGLERVTPRPESPGHERCEPDIRAWRERALEMPAPFQERDREKRFAVDLEQVESCEDLTPAELAGVGVALGVDLEGALVLPVVDEDALDDRGVAFR